MGNHFSFSTCLMVAMDTCHYIQQDTNIYVFVGCSCNSRGGRPGGGRPGDGRGTGNKIFV